MKKATLITLSFILTGCATFIPQTTTDFDDSRCNLVTKKLTLEVIPHSISDMNCHDSTECLVILGISALYTATTGLISGSIVLVGNTVHWLEKQGKCDRSLLNAYVTNHNQPLLENDGQLVKLKEE